MLLQKRFRARRQKRVFFQLASNYNEDDPISLETLSDLPVKKIAILKCPVNNKMFACDAVAWATYFANNHTTNHPCTRQRLDPDDIWNCYLTAFPFLGTDIREVFQSSNLTAIRRGRSEDDAVVIIRPVSPLFNVNMYDLRVVSETESTKKWLFSYALGDSRNIVMATKPLRIQMDLQKTDVVQISTL